MNVLGFVPDKTRKQVADKIRVIANKLEQADPSIVQELAVVGGQIIGMLRMFGVDPQKMAHVYLDKLFKQVDEAAQKDG